MLASQLCAFTRVRLCRCLELEMLIRLVCQFLHLICHFKAHVFWPLGENVRYMTPLSHYLIIMVLLIVLKCLQCSVRLMLQCVTRRQVPVCVPTWPDA